MDTKSHRLIFLLFLFVLLMVAACSDDDGGETLPTHVVLGTEVVAATAAPVSDLPTATQSLAEDTPDGATLPATWTVTPSPTLTETLTVTPSMTITDTPSPTHTATDIPTAEPNAIGALAELAMRFTPAPTSLAVDGTAISGGGLFPATQAPFGVTPTPAGILIPTAAAACAALPSGGFGQIFTNQNLVTQIGCPAGVTPTAVNYSAATQSFEQGMMLWMDTAPGSIYVFFNTGVYRRFDDTFDESVDPASGGETSPSGLFEPVRGFGKVWRTYPEVRSGLGWATGQESADSVMVMDFASGRMIGVTSQALVYILVNQSGIDSGAWSAVSGQY